MKQVLGKVLPVVAGVFLPLYVLWAVGVFLGKVQSNFAFVLFVGVLFTGLYWLLDRLFFAKERQQFAMQAADEAERAERQRYPWWLDWTAGLFPVILAVFLLRSFLFEPFKIPSGSMMPTLEVGDFILVNKYTYGVRLPVLNRKIVDLNTPERGDVMVFRYPLNENQDYIKRVIGLPGDEIRYINKRLTINGTPVAVKELEAYLQTNAVLYGGTTAGYTPQFQEAIPTRAGGVVTHRILNYPNAAAHATPKDGFVQFLENCQYEIEGVICKVPEGHYFMMGDNRDDSEDSRYWGFVPDKNIVGKAFFVWMNIGNLGRIGNFQ